MKSNLSNNNSINLELDQLLYVEQVKLLYDNTFIMLIGSFSNAAAVIILFWQQIPHINLAVWFGCLTFLSLARWLLSRRFKKRTGKLKKINYWVWMQIGSIFISAVIWGMLVIFLFPADSFPHQVFLAFVLGGLTAGYVATCSSIRFSILSFIIPTLLPLITRFLLIGDQIYIVMAGLITLFMGLMIATASRLHGITLTSLKLRFDNRDLISDLITAIEKSENLNQELTIEIDERIRAEKQLILAAAVFNNTAEGIVITDSIGIIQSVNPAFTAISGYNSEDVIGKKPDIFRTTKHEVDFYKELLTVLVKNGRWSGELWNKRKNGEVFPSWLSITTIKDKKGNVLQYAGIFMDITQRKHNEELIKFKAYHDALTGLPNRYLFNDRLILAISHAARDKSTLVVMFLDLDGFKAVNDNLGHDIGDKVLQQIGRRLELSVRKGDTVARLGGDEFILLIPQIFNSEYTHKIADKILSSFQDPLKVEEHRILVTASIGISIYPDDGQFPEQLLQKADNAMYIAKQKGKNKYQFYNS